MFRNDSNFFRKITILLIISLSCSFLYSENRNIQINEVMSNPIGNSTEVPGDKSNEFIELINIGTVPIDVRGWKIGVFPYCPAGSGPRPA